MKMIVPIMFDTILSPFDDFFEMIQPRSQHPLFLIGNYNPQQQKQHCRRNENCCGLRNPKNDGIVANLGDFMVKMDVQGFRPEEIAVKITDGNIISVEAKHEEKEDEHGFVYRHIVRKYTLPEGFDINNITSKLSADGQLAITAPKLQTGKGSERVIRIAHTDKPSTEGY